MIERIKQTLRIRQLKALFEKYERVLIPGTLVFGVIVDFITFRSIRVSTAFTILIVYFILAGVTVAFINAFDTHRIPTGFISFKYLRLAAPLLIQFTFGALLSASFIFYWFSGALSVSWPLLLIVVILMISNEVFRHYYLKPVVQVSVYFFISFSLSSLMLPFVFNSISPWLFLAGGVGSLLFLFGYLYLLMLRLPNIRDARHQIALYVIAIFATMNALYFLGVIPPIPLSIREADVYHDVRRNGNDYTLLAEQESLVDRLIPGERVHLRAGDPIYLFTSIFAPADLNTTIVHRWEYYDEARREWTRESRLSFSIIGGRDGGYRGYSRRIGLEPGLWRVNIETVRGQVLGRIRIKIVRVVEGPELFEVQR